MPEDNRDHDIEQIIRRLNAIPGLRDLKEMWEFNTQEEGFKCANASIVHLIRDAKTLLSELMP